MAEVPSIARIADLLHGAVRERSVRAIVAAEQHMKHSKDGLLILQMVGGLLEVSFLPDLAAGSWEVALRPTEES